MAARRNTEPSKNTMRLINHCPICDHEYNAESARLLVSKNNAECIHNTCYHCKGYFLTVVMPFGKGTSTVGIVTDLSFYDIKRLYGKHPLSIDEILEVHTILSSPNLQQLLSVSK